MWKQRGTAIAVGLACLATLLGHGWLARHHERRIEQLMTRSDDFSPMFGSMDPPSPDEVTASLPDEVFSTGRSPRLLSRATYEALSFESDEPADALRPAAGDHELSSSPPQAVRPLTRRQREIEATVRDVIEEEMPETSAEERDIWFEELRSLPAEAVRDLLKVRKQLRVLSPDHQLSGPSQLFPLHAPHAPIDGHEIPAETVVQTRPARQADWSETRQALEQAIAWSTHNLANAATPGYKRIEVILGDAYSTADSGLDQPFSMPSGGRGCCIQALRLDMQQGNHEETSSPLDLGIHGEGLFMVRDANTDQTYFTRRGGWTRNSDGTIELLDGDLHYLLEPPLIIPVESIDMNITSNGTVSTMRSGGVDPVQVGQIELARFADPSRLIPVGRGLYVAPPDVTPTRAAPGSPGMGVLRQCFLEQSNVDVEQETSNRDAWEAILRTLSAGDIPARPVKENSRRIS